MKFTERSNDVHVELASDRATRSYARQVERLEKVRLCRVRVHETPKRFAQLCHRKVAELAAGAMLSADVGEVAVEGSAVELHLQYGPRLKIVELMDFGMSSWTRDAALHWMLRAWMLRAAMACVGEERAFEWMWQRAARRVAQAEQAVRASTGRPMPPGIAASDEREQIDSAVGKSPSTPKCARL